MKKKQRAFTLIELLVVISIISLLLTIVMPGLNLAKRKAAAILCTTNTKNLSLGWFSYKEDYHDNIMSANMGGVKNKTCPSVPGWIGEPYHTTAGDRSCTGTTVVTDDDEIRGIEKGALNEYLKSPKVFNCPSDKVVSRYDLTEKFVTYAIPTALYGFDDSSAYFNYQIKKYSEITTPSLRYSFVETAEERNWTMYGHFVLGAPEYTNNSTWGWWGPMAVNHGDSSVLGFCDGHAEIHKWRDAYTKERVDKLSRQDTDNYSIEYPPDGQTDDIEYMASGWAYRFRKK